MSAQKPETDPRALAHRAAEELASGGYQAAQTTALVAIAAALTTPRASAGAPPPSPMTGPAWTASLPVVARVISNADELAALPDRSVILDRDGDAWQRDAWQRDASHSLAESYGDWLAVGSEVPSLPDEIPMPTRVIHLGGQP